MALSSSVKQWGLLSWNKRWMTYDGGVIKLFKSEVEPAAGSEPIVTFDLAQAGCKFEVDPVNASRLSLDNSIALIHIKFDDAATRDVSPIPLPRAPLPRRRDFPSAVPRMAQPSLNVVGHVPP